MSLLVRSESAQNKLPDNTEQRTSIFTPLAPLGFIAGTLRSLAMIKASIKTLSTLFEDTNLIPPPITFEWQLKLECIRGVVGLDEKKYRTPRAGDIRACVEIMFLRALRTGAFRQLMTARVALPEPLLSPNRTKYGTATRLPTPNTGGGDECRHACERTPLRDRRRCAVSGCHHFPGLSCYFPYSGTRGSVTRGGSPPPYLARFSRFH
jgi:hypothetical protein